jgi:hypothetical protein
MDKPTNVLILALVFSMFGAATQSPLQAKDPQAANPSWDNLKTLSRGQEIRVVLNGAQSYQGEFQSSSDTGITLRRSGGDQILIRQDVLRIASEGKKHRGRNALIGAAIGAGVGLGLGAAVDESGKGGIVNIHNWGLAIGAPLGALLGAGVGALLPTGGWHDVYRVHR